MLRKFLRYLHPMVDIGETDHRPRRGRPRAVDLSQVIDAAIEIGLDRVTLAGVADRLGIGTTTLYGYVESSDALSIAVASRLIDDFDPPHEPTWTLDEVLVAFGAELRRLFVSHPGLVDVIAHNVNLPAIIDDAERGCSLLVDRGLAARDAELLHGSVAHFVIAFESVPEPGDGPPARLGPILTEAGATAPDLTRDEYFRWVLGAHVAGMVQMVESGSGPWAGGPPS